jgi:hypothetical protein
MTHFLRTDYRVQSLFQIITGLDNSINFLKKNIQDNLWYDGDWFRQDAEPIYGLAFIALQNYINSSIKDFSGNTSDKIKYYKTEPDLDDFNKTSIELIIGLANYSKHKDDDGNLHSGTKEILECFGLNVDKDSELDESPILNGLNILSDKWDLFVVLKTVTTWRENLWLNDN